MKLFAKYWKALLALLLAAAAAFLYINVYQTEKAAYESEKQMLQTTNQALTVRIAEDRKYEPYQDEINAAREELQASRLDLYNHLPVDVKEEDQIMYVLYLESVFGKEISFEFSEAVPVMTLGDGSILKSVDLIVNYHSTYEGFQQMVNYLAQDSRVVSIDKADIKYYPRQDLAIGYIKVRMYLLDTTNSVDEEIRKYVKPEVINEPESGKENIFDNDYNQSTNRDVSRDDLKPGGGSDLDSKVWVTTFDGKYHAHYGCAYNSQVYHNMEEPVQMTLAEIKNYGIQPCEYCFG